MRVKTFRGESSSAVLRRIKVELGGDAVILSTRSFKEQGVSICEITAALEDASETGPLISPASEAPQAQSPHASRSRNTYTAQMRPAPAAHEVPPSPANFPTSRQAHFPDIAQGTPQLVSGDHLKDTPQAQCGKQAGPMGRLYSDALPLGLANALARDEPPAVHQPQHGPQLPHEDLLGSVPSVGSWQQEWAKIREHLLASLKPQLQLDSLSPRQRHALEYLEREGVEDCVLIDLACVLQRRPEASVLAPLAQVAPVAPLDFTKLCHSGGCAGTPRFLAFAGPHGVGKTSAVIRSALQARAASPSGGNAGRICLLNADVHRSQGRLLLRQYAELADIDYLELAPGQEMEDILPDCAHASLVVVDLPALARGETMEQLRQRLGLQALDAAGGLAILLTLSPHFATNQLQQFGRQYCCANMTGLVWTKLDEAYTFGNLVNTAYALGLPAMAFSAGPGMQDDLVPATHKALWGLVFKHRLPVAA